MKRRLATLFVALSSAFVAFGFASCQIIQWQPDWGFIENVNRYEIELDTTEFESVVPYDSEFDYQSIKLIYKAYLGEEEQPFYELQISLKPNMVTGGLDTTTPGEKELIIEYGGESFLLPYVVKYQVDFLSKGEVFNTQYVLSSDEVVVPQAKEQEGYTFAYWKSEVPEVLTENVAIEAHYYNNALHAPVLETIDCTYDPNATVAQLTLPSNKNGSWEFVDPALPVGDAGSHEYEVRFVSKTDELAPVANELVKVQVAKKAVAAPAVSASLVYAATTQKATVTDVETDDSLYAIVNEGGINAGNYSATATLKDVKNYVWKDTDNWTEVDEATGILTFKYTIAPKQVTFVIETETFTYNRGEQFPTYTFADGFDNAHITAADVTVTGTPQVNADTYEYGFAMNNANYVGSYSGTFTIEQKELTFIVDSKSFVYDGTEHYPTYSFADPEDLPNVRVMSGKPQTEAGSGYKYGWLVMDDNYTGMHTGTFAITKPDVTVTAVLAQTEITYPAAIPEITFTVEGFAGDEALLNITVEKPTANVGTHEITPVVNNANVNATCVSATLTINKGTPEYYRPTLSTDGLQGTAAIYGDTISTVTFSDEGFGTWAWKNPDLVIDRMSDFSAVAVFTPQDPNLNQLEKELFITNEYRQIAKRTLNIVVTKNEYTYTGEEFALEYTIVDATDPEGYTIELDKLTVSGNSVETEAGEHNKTLEIVSDYYKGVVSPKLIIQKATPVVSLTVDHGNVTYRPALTLANSGLTPIGTAHRANDDEPVEGTFTWSDGAYKLHELAIGVATPVEVVFTPTGEKANNYNSVILTYNVTVDKADSVIQKVEGSNKVALLETYEKVYDANAFAFKAQVSRDNELPDTSTITYTYKNVATGVESATITEAGEYELTISVGATTHYNGATATVIVRITQASNEWKAGPAIPNSSWTYKNQGSNQISATAKFGTSTIVITYTNTTTGTVYHNADNKLPTDAEAGTYVASVVLPETSNWAGLSAEVTFTVNKAKVTTLKVGFVASNSTNYTGQAQIPTVNGSYENGSIGGVGYTVEYLNRDSIDVGTYQVRITLNDATNYVWSGTDSNVYEAEYKIEQATNRITSLSIDGWKYLEYDAAENAPVATATFGSLADISYSYYTSYPNAFNRVYEVSLDDIKVATVKTYYVRADIAATENYTAASKIQSFNISNADLTEAQKAELFAQPYEVTWFSGITIENSGIQLPNGNYTWTNENQSLDTIGENNCEAKYEIANYNAVTGNFKVTVKQASATLTAGIPEADRTFTYTGTAITDFYTFLQLSTDNGEYTEETAKATVTYNVVYTGDGTYDGTICNAGTYKITANLPATTHYEAADMAEVTIAVKKVENKQTIPEMKATYGETLSKAKDSGGKALSDYNDTYGEWSWEDGNDTLVGNATTHTYTAKYTPKAEYAGNYAGRTGVEVTVIVAKKAIALPTLTKTSFVYNGSVQKPEIPASDDYSVSDWSNENSTNVANNYTVTLKLSDENYAWSGTGASVSGLNATYTYAITKATLTVTENKIQTATYGDKVVEKLTLPVSTFNGNKVGTWAWRNVTAETTVGDCANKHYFEAECALTGDDAINFNSVSIVTVEVTVNRATPTLTVTDNCHKTYDGTAFAFAEGDISISHDETAEISYQYKLADSTEEAQSGLPTNAGMYTVTVTLSGSANYKGTSTIVTVTIEQATPTATVENVAVGANLFELREQIGNPTYGTWDWTHATNTPFTDAKTYECKVPFLRNSNNYKTEGIITVYVGKAAVSATIALDSNVYTGSEIGYTVTVTVGNTVDRLTEGTQYTVTCDTIQDAGEYTVTITLLDATFKDYLWATTDSTVTIQGAVLTKKITIASATNGWKDGKKPTVSGGVYNGSAYAANTQDCKVLFGTYETKYYKVEGSVETELIGGAPANAGSYRVRFVGDESANYTQLNDFLDFTITPKAITPTLSGAENLIYNKDAQIVTASTEEGVDFTVACANATVNDNSISVTNAGDYTVVFTLTSNNYVWKDNVNTVSFAVARKQITETDVKAIASATKTVDYDGTNKLPVLTGYEGFEAEITKAEAFAGTIVNKGVDAGNYTLTLKLTDATNYEFADGLTLTYDFTINRAKATATITKTSATYNGSTHSPTISVTSGTLTVKYKVNGGDEITGDHTVTKTNAGTYTYAITLVDTTNFELTAGSSLNFTINKATVGTVSLAQNEFTYTGSPAALSYTVQTMDGTIILEKGEDKDYTTNDVETNVGNNYELVITLSNNFVFNGGGNTATLTYSITKATATVKLELTNYTWQYGLYNEEENKCVATVEKLFTDSVKVAYRYATNSNGTGIIENFAPNTQNAGTYYVQAYAAGTDNYDVTASAWTEFTISKVKVDVSDLNLEDKQGANALTYTGDNQLPVTAGDKGDYTISINDSTENTGLGVNADTYIIKLTLDDTANYEWKGTVQASYTYVIKPATVTLNVPTTSFEYTGSPITVDIVVKAGDTELTEDTDYTVSGNGETNADEYTITVTLTNANYTFGTSNVATQSYTITKSSNYTASVTNPDPMEWDATRTLGKITLTTSSSINGTFTYDTNASLNYIDERSFTVTFTPKNTNYATKELTVTVTITKATASISGVSETYSMTYGEELPTINEYANHEEAEITRSYERKLADGTYKRVDSLTNADAGTYRIIFSLVETDHYKSAVAEANVTIAKKAITPSNVKVNYTDDSNVLIDGAATTTNGTKYYYENLMTPKLSEIISYNVTGVNGELAVNPDFAMNTDAELSNATTTDGVMLGTKTVTVTFTLKNDADKVNYEIVYPKAADGSSLNYYPVTVTLKGVAYIGSTYYYGTIENAVTAANTANGGTIYVVPDVPTGNAYTATSGNVIIKQNVTLKSGVTLCLPYDGTTYKTRSTNGSVGNFADSTSGNVTTYRKSLVTIAEGVTLTVQSGANLQIGGVIGVQDYGQQPTGQTCGAYAEILMQANAKILSYGTVDCCGYIKESESNNGSMVEIVLGTAWAPYVIYDFRGGTATAGAYNKGNISPFSVYDMPNVQPFFTIHAAAMLKGYADLYANGSHNTTEIENIIANTSANAILNLSDGATVTLKYTPQTNGLTTNYTGDASDTLDKDISLELSNGTILTYAKGTQFKYATTDMQICGGASLGAMSMKIVSVTVNTSGVLFPITWKQQMTLKNGNYTINNPFKLVSGATLTVEEDATLNVGKSLIVYPKSSLDSQYAGNMIDDVYYFNYVVAYPAKDPAQLIVKGAMNVTSSASIGGIITAASENAKLVVASGATFTVTSKEGNGETKSDSFLDKLNAEFVLKDQITQAFQLLSYGSEKIQSRVADTYDVVYENGKYYWKGRTTEEYKPNFTFEDNNGSDISTLPIINSANSQSFVYNTTVALNGATLDGVYEAADGKKYEYEWLGWYDASGNPVTNYIVTGAKGVTLIGKFQAKEVAETYTIKFNTDGTDFTIADLETTVLTIDFTTSSLATYKANSAAASDVNTQQYLIGWSNTQNVTTAITSLDATMFTGNAVTLYPVWANKPTLSITITQNDGGATLSLVVRKLGTTTKEYEKNVASKSENFSKTIYIHPDQEVLCKVTGSNSASGSIDSYTPMGTRNRTVTATGSTGGGCVTPETLITLADGTQKKVEDLTTDDEVLVFNHATGKLETNKLLFVAHKDEDATMRRVLHLQFSNGETLKIVEQHGFYDNTLNQYVYIDENNVAKYINHSFYSASYQNGGFIGEKVVLVNAYVTEEVTKIYSPVSAYNMNVFASNMLTVTPLLPGIEGLVNIFEYDEDMKYNEEKMLADIEKYGLYTIEDFAEYYTYEQFIVTSTQYFKVAVGKGYLTYEEALMCAAYITQNKLLDHIR